MNQEKIGRFIASCRRNQGLTQAHLAEQLGITDRAVSKWETGRSLPDASIMPELCDLLKINLSELFSGERIAMENYKETSDALLLEMKKQEELANRKLLSSEVVIGGMATITFLVMVFAASFIEMDAWVRMLLIAVGMVIFLVGIIYAVKIEHDAGYYECPECGYTYIPAMKAVFFAPHIWRNRKMTCPQCGKRVYCKKVLTK